MERQGLYAGRLTSIAQEERSPEIVFLGSTTRRTTRRELAERGVALASDFHSRGVAAGDVIAAVMWAEPAAFTSLFASIQLDACFAAALPILSPDDARRVLRPLRPAVFGRRSEASEIMTDIPIEMRVDGDEWLVEGRSSEQRGRRGNPAGRVIVHTSGATGRPKRVVHSDVSLHHTATAVLEAANVTDDDCFLHFIPPGHGLGTGLMIVPLERGCRVVCLEIWDPARAVASVANHGVTFAAGTPFFLGQLFDAARPGSLGSLRVAMVAGDHVSDSLYRKAELHNVELMNFYALSEIAVGAGRFPGRLLPFPGVEVQVRGQEWESLGAVAGELLVEGPGRALGYINDGGDFEAASAGLHPTGDVGEVGPDSSFTILGRIGDMAVRGGENISLVEVDLVLRSLPGVGDAAAAAIPLHGSDLIVAALVSDGRSFSPPAVAKAFQALGVSEHKAPRRLRMVETIPRTSTGKVLRSDVAELFRSRR